MPAETTIGNHVVSWELTATLAAELSVFAVFGATVHAELLVSGLGARTMSDLLVWSGDFYDWSRGRRRVIFRLQAVPRVEKYITWYFGIFRRVISGRSWVVDLLDWLSSCDRWQNSWSCRNDSCREIVLSLIFLNQWSHFFLVLYFDLNLTVIILLDFDWLRYHLVILIIFCAIFFTALVAWFSYHKRTNNKSQIDPDKSSKSSTELVDFRVQWWLVEDRSLEFLRGIKHARINRVEWEAVALITAFYIELLGVGPLSRIVLRFLIFQLIFLEVSAKLRKIILIDRLLHLSLKLVKAVRLVSLLWTCWQRKETVCSEFFAPLFV